MTQTISAERIEEMLATADALTEFSDIDEAEGGNPYVIAAERLASTMLRDAASALRAQAQGSEAVAWRPTYEQIIALVEDCRVRRDKAGESSRVMSKWISEGLNALYASPPVQAQPQVKAVVNAAEPLRRSMESESPNRFLRDDIEVMLDAVAALAASPAPVDGWGDPQEIERIEAEVKTLLADPVDGLVGEKVDLDDELRIDALRLNAFRTNSPDDLKSYYEAASKWFQRRFYRRLAVAALTSSRAVVAQEGK